MCIHRLELATVNERTRRTCWCVSSSQVLLRFIFFPCPLFWAFAIAVISTLGFHIMRRVSWGTVNKGALTSLYFSLFIHTSVFPSICQFFFIVFILFSLFPYFYRNFFVFFVVCLARVKLDAVSGTDWSTHQFQLPGWKCGQSAAVSACHFTKILDACTNDFHLKRWMVQKWWVEQRMAWREVGKLVAGNTASGVLDIPHEWKIHSGQDSQRLPPV